MKKLKQMSGPYSIGFELSSTAHGFVATDPNGNVLYHGKQAGLIEIMCDIQRNREGSPQEVGQIADFAGSRLNQEA